MKILALILILALSGAPASAAPAKSEVEEMLLLLRDPDPEELMESLRSIPMMEGYPDSALPLLPALLWIRNRHGDIEAGREAEAQARALGWPERRCLSCLRKFAASQDKLYKIMGLEALVQIAWIDPEAMTILFEITKDARGGMGDLTRGFASNLRRIDCSRRAEMDGWNLQVQPYLGRMQSALSVASWQLRPLAEAVLACPLLRDDLRHSLQQYLARVREPFNGLTPTPLPAAMPPFK